ncbi:MAG: response regulator transcription factor [Brotaphodocola sp.]
MARILITDDEPDIYQLVRRYAEHEGHETMSAANGIEALELCRKHDFDVIVMDVMMPGMDGFTACKQIKRIKDTPVLMLSARGEEYDKLLGFEIGIDDYMVKPFSSKELMARINVIVNRHRIQSGQDTVCQNQIQLGALQIDRLGRNVQIDGKRV